MTENVGYVLDRIKDTRDTILSYIEDRGDVVEAIREIALVKYNNALINWDETRQKEIHATDLLSPCLRSSYYSKLLPPLYDLESIMRMLVGKLFHDIPILKHHEYKILWEGIHFSIDEYEDGFVIEKKTTDKIKRSWGKNEFGVAQPYPYHVEQLKVYKAALEATGHHVYKTLILYLDRSSGELEVCDVDISNYDVEQVKQELLAKRDVLKDCLDKNILPMRTVCWKCSRFCGYPTLCFSNMNVVKVK